MYYDYVLKNIVLKIQKRNYSLIEVERIFHFYEFWYFNTFTRYCKTFVI